MQPVIHGMKFSLVLLISLEFVSPTCRMWILQPMCTTLFRVLWSLVLVLLACEYSILFAFHWDCTVLFSSLPSFLFLFVNCCIYIVAFIMCYFMGMCLDSCMLQSRQVVYLIITLPLLLVISVLVRRWHSTSIFFHDEDMFS